MTRVHPLPTMLTLGNFGCGFVAIMLAARSFMPNATVIGHDPIILGAACIFFAMIFDMLDGKVARMTGSACQFGAEMDSLADVVSFGIAPAAILTISWFQVEPQTAKWWSMTMGFAFIYACCACLRLARYNVEATVTAKDYFRGLPSPGAAGAVASIFLIVMDKESDFGVLLHKVMGSGPEADLLIAKAMAVYMLLIGLLMVTRIRYPHATNKMLKGRKRFSLFIVALFGVALFIMAPWYMLAAGFNGYVLYGLVNEARLRYKRGKAMGWKAAFARDTDAPAIPAQNQADIKQ